ncbi:MAG: class I SAM-dependent methyltransferase [Bradyrhizobium sp.]
MTALSGIHYVQFMKQLHDTLKPNNYLEIGTLAGGTLRVANCQSIAIDPDFKILTDVIGKKSALHLFQQTSDSFFRSHDPKTLFGGSLDLAFLDGMHLFEFLLRDFINTERHCRRNSIIAIHDCVPPHPHNALRSASDARRAETPTPDWWTGDVWKLIPTLKHYRPDLRIYVLDCPPTGLVLVTNLESNSTILESEYAAILAKFADLELDEYGMDKFATDCNMIDSKKLQTLEQLSRLFWI